MSESNYIASCHYCGREMRLSSLGNLNASIDCQSCGAPLKTFRDIHPPRPKAYRPHRIEAARPIREKKQKPKKKTRRKFSLQRAAFEFFEEAIDEITDIFD